MSNIEIHISGNTSGFTSGGTLTLFDNEPISLSLSVNDVRELDKVKSSFSKNFLLPADKNNNKLFSHLFNVGVDGKFDPRKKAKAYILEDSIPVMEGNMQLLTINIENGIIKSYDVAIFSETINLISSIEGKLLTDLDFSELNHTLNSTTIQNSWTNTGNTYYYGLVDYGYGWDKNTIQGISNGGYGIGTEQVFPSTSVPYIWNKILSGNGYTTESTILNSNDFKELVIPFNNDPNTLRSAAYCDAMKFKAHFNAPASTPWGIFNQVGTYNWATPVGVGYGEGTNFIIDFDNSNLYTSNLFTWDYYTSNDVSIQQFKSNVTIALGNISNYNEAYVSVHFYRDSYSTTVPFRIDKQKYTGGINSTQSFTFSSLFLTSYSGTTHYPLQNGELIQIKIQVEIGLTTANSWSPNGGNAFTVNEWTFYNEVKGNVPDGGNVVYNNYIPKNFKQTDFIKDIIKIHNLYIEPDKNNSKKLFIESRDTFYESGEELDWSDKLDLSKPIKESLISEKLPKKIKFSYKDDDKDYLLNHYKGSINETFGTYKEDLVNDFTKDTYDVSLMFSPTCNAKIANTNNFIIPMIYQVDSNNNYARVNSNIRILKKNIGLSLATNGDWFKFYNTAPLYQYPYMGHLNTPYSGNSYDINFGTVNYEYFSLSAITSNNLVYTYWKGFLNQLKDKDSKLITCYLKLTNSDINKWSFRNTVFIDGISPEGGHWYIVNKIDYVVTNNESSKVELLKLPYKSVVIPPSTVLQESPDMGDPAARMSLSLAGGRNTTSGSITIGNNSISTESNIINIGYNNLIESSSSYVIGDNNRISNSSSGTTIVGVNNTIDNNNNNVNVFGNNNDVANYSDNTFISGNNNRIVSPYSSNLQSSGITAFSTTVSATTDSVIFGSNNIVDSGSTKNYVIGDNNYVVSGITAAFVIGNNITANTSNVLYTNDIQTNSTARINGIPTSAATISYQLWTSGNTNTNNYGIAASNPTLPTANGTYAIAMGEATQASGSRSTAGGSYSLAGSYASVAIGDACTTSGNSAVAMGSSTQAIGDYSVALGLFNIASGNNSTVIGYATQTIQTGEFASSSYGGANKYDQAGFFTYSLGTTNATITDIYVGATGTERLIIPNNSNMYIKITTNAVISSGGNAGASITYTAEGLIKNVGGTCSFVGTITPLGTTFNDDAIAGIGGSAYSIVGNTLRTQVTGIAATNINWFIKMEYSRCSY